MKQHRWMVQNHAWCEECDWQPKTDDGRFWLVTKRARRHAAKTGHEVHGEQGFTYRYNERDA